MTIWFRTKLVAESSTTKIFFAIDTHRDSAITGEIRPGEAEKTPERGWVCQLLAGAYRSYSVSDFGGSPVTEVRTLFRFWCGRATFKRPSNGRLVALVSSGSRSGMLKRPTPSDLVDCIGKIMSTCTACGTELAGSGRFCSSCGTPTPVGNEEATFDFAPASPPPSPRPGPGPASALRAYSSAQRC